MNNRQGSISAIGVVFLVSIISIMAPIKQWELLDDFTEPIKNDPSAIFVIIIVWFLLMFLLSRSLKIRVTPWFGVMCLFLALLVGYWWASPNPEKDIEQTDVALEALMNYLNEHHSTLDRIFLNITWSGENITPSDVNEYTIYQYLGGGWNITLNWMDNENLIYDVNAEYTSTEEDLHVFWEGTVEPSGVVEEKIKGSYQGIESVRGIILEHLQETILESSINLKSVEWSLAPQEPLVGWTKYTYLHNEWNITIKYQVHYDITYYVSVENSSENLLWKGTVYDGIVSDEINIQ